MGTLCASMTRQKIVNRIDLPPPHNSSGECDQGTGYASKLSMVLCIVNDQAVLGYKYLMKILYDITDYFSVQVVASCSEDCHTREWLQTCQVKCFSSH